METGSKKRLSPTVIYILTALVMSWPCLAFTARALPDWANGITLSNESLVVIHGLILGILLTVAYGVSWQFIPIAFQARPLPRHLLYWHLPLHLASVWLMVIGFYTSDYLWVGIGGTTLLLAGLGFFSSLVKSYLTARNRTPVHGGLALPFMSLFLVIGLGLWQAFVPNETSAETLALHVMLGGFAFWGGLVMVISYKFLPMFTLSHGYKANLRRFSAVYYIGLILFGVTLATLPSLHQASVILLVGRFVQWASLLLCAIGLLGFVRDARRIVVARKRKRIVRPIIYSMIALAILLVSQFGMLIAVAFGHTEWLVGLAYVFVFGGLLPMILSYTQKIVPFLWFEYRFSKRPAPERKAAPGIDEMVSPRMAHCALILYFLGALVGAVVVFTGTLQSVFSPVSAALLVVASAILFLSYVRVIRIGGKRPPDEPRDAVKASV